MRTRIKCLGVAAASLLAVALPATASAEYFVPPGNSAATQYTEAYPTAGGHRDAEHGQGGGGRSPSQALGEDNARRLESQGEAGREAAEFAAETAPAGATGAPSRGNGTQTGRHGPSTHGGVQEPSGKQGGGEGSSGIGEVLGQATGSSSGEMGLLLPLIIIGALASALAFLWWRKSTTA